MHARLYERRSAAGRLPSWDTVGLSHLTLFPPYAIIPIIPQSFAMTTKTADNKGRIALGPRFANKTVIIEEIDETEIRVTVAAVVPERELWLHKNVKAKS